MVTFVRGRLRRQFRVRRGSCAVPRFLPTIILLLGFGGCVLLSACAGLGGSKPGEGEFEPVLFPSPPERPRIQFLTAYNSDRNVLPRLSAFRRFVLGDREARKLRKP
jgi:hypothetical protein